MDFTASTYLKISDNFTVLFPTSPTKHTILDREEKGFKVETVVI